MDWNDRVLLWKNDDKLINHLKKELYDITDENELEDRFYQYLEFGTGGMRGELGVGTNRINEYTIKRVALGLAIYIKSNGLEKMNQGVAISYDNRYFSKDFAQITACTLASYGIKVYLSDQMRPTPELSYAVRHYSCFLGVMITASHNPKNYNGFKVYDEDGGQITLNVANELQSILSEIDYELTISSNELSDYIEQGLILTFSKELDQSYLNKLNSVVLNEELIKSKGSDLKVVYTPLHGTGLDILPQALEKFGFTNLSIVKEQADSDPGFSTISSPNPEEKNAFNLALKLAEKSDADVVIATDPDADRLGIVIYDQGEPIYLNGNQIGVLLLDYLTKHKKDNELENYFIAKTIVTSNLGEKIAQNYDIEVKNTLTGFKFIGEQIKISKEVNGKIFLFGYEESYGYLISPFVRDKDAIQAALLFSEVALVNKINNKEKSLMDNLDEIYQKYGYFEEDLVTYEFGSKQGLEKMNQMMEILRVDKKIDFSGFTITKIADYLYQEVHDIRNNEIKSTQLPCSNVLKFIFEDDSWICFRPSGTEPKLKIYFSVTSVSKNSSKEKLEKLKKIAVDIISDIEFKLG